MKKKLLKLYNWFYRLFNQHCFDCRSRSACSATRKCFDLKKRELVGKSCRLEVVKIGESKNKQRYLELANQKKGC